MLSIKELKKNALKTLKNNVWTLILASIIITLISGKMSIHDNTYQNVKLIYDFCISVKNEGGIEKIKELDKNKYKELIVNSSNELLEQALYGDLSSRIQDYNKKNNIKKGILYTAVNTLSEGQSIIKNYVNEESNSFPQSVFIMCIIAMIVLLIRVLFINPLRIGNSRLFLESIKYKKSRLRVLEYSFKEHYYYESVNTMFIKDLYVHLWAITIIGGIIKHYSYFMVEYITAENPFISAKDCIFMSRTMMNGYKRKALLLDISFLLWNVLAILTLGLAGVFVTPYYEACKAELYRKLREEYINGEKFNYKELNDELLFNNSNNYSTYENSKQGKSKEESEKRLLDIYELNTKYDLWDYVMFFFIFAFAGWIWEVGYFILHFGVLVNRGAMYGPWLPIYGVGCTFVVLLFSKFKVLKRIQTNPLKTFFCVMIVCTILEYLTSIYLELVTGEKYWNYTGIFLNVNGRVCLENSMFFGAGGCLCIYFVAPWLQKRIRWISTKTRELICVALITLFLIDLAATQVQPHYGDYISNDPSLQNLYQEEKNYN